MTEDRKQELLLLGEIKGIVSGLKETVEQQNQRFDQIDARLRTVEQKAAVTGALSGGAMSIGVALIAEGIKTWLKGGASGGG
jgi:hypothetical protein